MFSKKKQQKLIEKVNMIKPTSKYALKQQCLMLCNLKTKESKEMYDFLIEGIEESIPDVEPSQKSPIQNFGDSANGVLNWIRENKDILSQGLEMVRGLFSKGNSVNSLPPINE